MMQFWTAVRTEQRLRHTHEEIEISAALQKRKSAGVDNIQSELVRTGEETVLDVLTRSVT